MRTNGKYKAGDIVIGITPRMTILAQIVEYSSVGGYYTMIFFYSSILPFISRTPSASGWTDKQLRLATEIEKALYL